MNTLKINIGPSNTNIKKINLHNLPINSNYIIKLLKNPYKDIFKFKISKNILYVKRLDELTGWGHPHSVKIFIYSNKNNWIILLTTAVSNINNSIKDTEYRKKLYTNRILKWLKYTNYTIVVVESSGYNFPDINNNRLYKINFKFDKELPSSSQYEAQSILYALNAIKDTDFYKKCSHILKVTGRYFLKDIEQHLYLEYKDLYLQKHRVDTWQNTEYFGIKKELFPIFLETVKDLGFIENKIWDFSNTVSYCHIGYFKNKIRRGGDNMLIENL